MRWPTSEGRLARVEAKVEEQTVTNTDLRGLILGLDGKIDRLILSLDRKIDRIDERIERFFLWIVGIQFGILVAIIAALMRR